MSLNINDMETKREQKKREREGRKVGDEMCESNSMIKSRIFDRPVYPR